MIRITMIAAALAFAGTASAQTFTATEVGQPCPPMSVPVKLQDGRWVCAVAATLTPLENPMPKDAK